MNCLGQKATSVHAVPTSMVGNGWTSKVLVVCSTVDRLDTNEDRKGSRCAGLPCLGAF
jgi:hypothetical protein